MVDFARKSKRELSIWYEKRALCQNWMEMEGGAA